MFRLSTRPSVLALVMDVLVVAIAAPVIFADAPMGVRVAAGVISVVAAILGVRSALLLSGRTVAPSSDAAE